MSLQSSYVYNSRFIRILVTNGYNGTLTTLLCDLNLDKFACDTADIIDLLRGMHNGIGISNDLVNKIGVENAIIICDELCAPRVIDKIIEKEIMLNTLLEHQLINYPDPPFRRKDYIDIYGRGYRVITLPVKKLKLIYDTIRYTFLRNN